MANAMSPVDADVIGRAGVRELLIADITEAFRQGSRGAAWDVVVLGRGSVVPAGAFSVDLVVQRA
jgi:hypothetical protein